VRVWNVNEPTKTFLVGKCRSKRGQRIAVTSCAFNRDGKRIVCGCIDGSIQIFNLSEKIIRPYKQLYGAHEPDHFITAVAFAHDGFRLVTRSTDSTMKDWDIRTFKTPEHTLTNLPCFYETTDCVYSPDERWIVTGTSSSEKEVGNPLPLLHPGYDLLMPRGSLYSSLPRLVLSFPVAGGRLCVKLPWPFRYFVCISNPDEMQSFILASPL